MQRSDKIVFWAVLSFIGLVLSSKPNCNRGCKTVAEHLITHGFDEMMAALLA